MLPLRGWRGRNAGRSLTGLQTTGGAGGKESPCRAGEVDSIPGSTWQPTPVILLGKSHGQKNLAGYSPWGCKESDMTEHTHIQHTHTHPPWKFSSPVTSTDTVSLLPHQTVFVEAHFLLSHNIAVRNPKQSLCL